VTREQISNKLFGLESAAVLLNWDRGNKDYIDNLAEARDKVLAEFDRLRDCERVVWCLTVGVKQRDSRIGRKTGPRTWMVRPFNPEEFVFCHLATDPANDFECNLGPNFSISESADPDRIRRIIDAEMAKEQGQ